MRTKNEALETQRRHITELLGMVNASWTTQAISVAARLGLADLLANGPRSAPQLAVSTETNTRALRQLLRALCSLDVCTEVDEDTFAITPLGELLRTDAACSVRSWAIYWGGTAWKSWEHLLYSVRSGASARALVTGADGFAHLEKDRQAAAIFNQAMVELTRLVAYDVVRSYDFALKEVADVGGGYGELLAAILAAYPNASGILFDMPHPIEEARRRFRDKGLDERCTFLEGDFFERIPVGADVYVLKSIVHDWNDERAQAILGNCRRDMPATARLLLIERVMPRRLSATAEDRSLSQTDLNMLVQLGARERTQEQYTELLSSTGFTNVTYRPAGMLFSLIEAEVRR